MCRSDLLGRSGVEFLSPNNSVVVAHAGSSAFLSCRLTKSPSFGMVSTKVGHCVVGYGQYVRAVFSIVMALLDKPRGSDMLKTFVLRYCGRPAMASGDNE